MRVAFVLAIVAVTALVVVATVALADVGLAPPRPASESAAAIRDLYWFIVVVSAAVFVAVEGVLVIFLVRFRSGGRAADVEGPQIHGNRTLELAWTVVPVLLVAAIIGATFAKLPAASGKASDGELRIRVEAHQFYWQYVYPTGAIGVDRLRLPRGRAVRLDVVSFDVIHSWFVPALGGKIDAIPGRTNHIYLRALRVGEFRGQCAEFCGVLHSQQLTTVSVLPPRQFDQWLRAETLAQRQVRSTLGRDTFVGVCAKCHGPRGEGGVGPAISADPQIRELDALRALLRDGQDSDLPGYMPPVGRGWPEWQYLALVRYLRLHES